MTSHFDLCLRLWSQPTRRRDLGAQMSLCGVRHGHDWRHPTKWKERYCEMRAAYLAFCTFTNRHLRENWLPKRSISVWKKLRNCRGCYRTQWDDKLSSSCKCTQFFTRSAVAEFYGPEDSSLCSPHVAESVSTCLDILPPTLIFFKIFRFHY